MRLAHLLLLACLSATPAWVHAELNPGELPAARWYAHIDLTEMRSSEAGRQVYAWFAKEAFEDMREEIGFDVDREADAITALASPEGAVTIVVDGEFSEQTRDRLLAIGAAASDFNLLEHDGREYFRIDGDDMRRGRERRTNAFRDGAYLSAALENKLIVTSTQEQMHRVLADNGRIQGKGGSGSLTILDGGRSFLQAGLATQALGDELGWESNMLRNTEELSLKVADSGGKLDVEAQLLATGQQMATSLASIVRGLISLQALNDEIDPALGEVLRGTSVEVKGATLVVQLAMDPKVLVEALD